MNSIIDQQRKAVLMTAAEYDALITDGWRPEVVTSLRDRGFTPCQPDLHAARFEDEDGTGFLSQSWKPDLFITLHRKQTLPEIDRVIFAAGQRLGHALLAGSFMGFFDRCKIWKPHPTDLTERLTKLEAQLAAQLPAA